MCLYGSAGIGCVVTCVICVLCEGTGCNAAYVEKVSNVDKWQGSVDDDAEVRIQVDLNLFQYHRENSLFHYVHDS